MAYLGILLYFISIAITVLGQRKLPSYITPCKRFSPQISECWEKTLRDLRPHLTKGIPEFDIPPITEFHVNHIHLDQGNTANVNFEADLFNLTFYGGENYEVTHTEADFKALTFNEGIFFPKLKMDGRYKAKGKVLLFEFEGEGQMEGEFENVQVNGTWNLKLIQKKKKEHIQVAQSEANVFPGKIWVYFHNLFRDNDQITKNVNKAINENTDVLYNDFKPLLQTTISSILDQYLNRVHSLYPIDVLLPVN